MKRARIGIIATAIFAVAAMAFAQKPDFTGTWTLDPEASGMAAGGGAPGGAPGGGGGRGGGGALGNGPATIKQTADTLTIERTMGENKVTTTYKLDGTEQTLTMGQGTAKATAKMDGGKIVIKTVRETPNGAMETTATYSLSADGKELTVVSASQRGERKMVYTKQ
jgi:hypothetical protein